MKSDTRFDKRRRSATSRSNYYEGALIGEVHSIGSVMDKTSDDKNKTWEKDYNRLCVLATDMLNQIKYLEGKVRNK